ncbi:MAG: hypothetical protein IT416_04170 [Candidatus Pacebacteria bacterium]|nr:hypothetical protein [Candidatus Paceibacterota bacterium]
MAKKPEVLVSTDIVGIWGNFDQLWQIYAQSLSALGGEKIAIEMLAWQHLIKNSSKLEKHPQLSIRGIHGPTGHFMAAPGIIEKAKAIFFQNIMADLETVVKARPDLFQAGQADNYLLVHEPELRRKGRIETLVSMNYPGHILVENVLDVGSLQATSEKVKVLRDQKVSAGIMIDLVHLIKEYTQSLKTLHTLDQKTFNETWLRVLKTVEVTINQLPKSGLHIPIGINGDSLPLELMTKQHWRDLAQVIKKLGEKIHWLTIENQPTDFDLNAFVVQPSMISFLADRNQKITADLAENEVI